MACKEDAFPLLDDEGASQHHGTEQRDRKVPPSRFDIESSSFGGSGTIRERQQQQQDHTRDRTVSRPSRGMQVATPAPFEPITDPFAFVCEIARRPKFGHQYVLCPERSRRRGDRRVGLSVGPHWAGVIYTISMIFVITLFLARVLIGPNVAPWCQPVIVACSMVTVVFLLATAVADPGIVVESAESEGASCGYCEECSIWRPQGAEHCEECGVCIFGLDHHCPWMGKCVGKGNILWFRLFNGSWILFLSFLMVAMPWINSHKDPVMDR
ncbi:unnamed protein product [Ectocarpus sp. 12 AP-2014]